MKIVFALFTGFALGSGLMWLVWQVQYNHHLEQAQVNRIASELGVMMLPEQQQCLLSKDHFDTLQNLDSAIYLTPMTTETSPAGILLKKNVESAISLYAGAEVPEECSPPGDA